MFFFLSKFLIFIINPLLWIIGLFIWGIQSKKASRKKKVFRATFCLLLVLTNPFLKNIAFQIWEPESIEITEVYDVAIVLGGFTDMNVHPRDRNNFNTNIERLTQILELYHQGLVKKILLTGGNSNIINKEANEALQVYDFLLKIGYPKEAILLEPKARNTHENALFTKALLAQKFPNGKYLLVTSAFHMYRSKKCFDKVQLPTTAYPVDYIQAPFEWTPNAIFLPSATCIQNWQMLIKEYLGIIVYKMKNYI